ncbi:MAG: sn-glycerol-3-phosphate ABC transporter ATP-binding protein UgpC [Chloroflexi bacterium]|nr:sn-glycerol-3-phosphate ABC transporter ATP-binding protein UgpC [Chloroflexota bacterium]
MARVLYSHVTKHFGDTVAVEDLTLEVFDKEFLVLIGPSGCGKSTVIRVLAGLEKLTAGEVYLDDVLVNDLPARDRDIAMVFQSYALYPHMSVFDNMAFGLKMHGVHKDEIKRRVTAAAETLGIHELLKRKPAQLSGGQRQRVALGRAIVREPKVFLFDEPLSNLDAKLRVQTRAELSKLHDRLGTTFIYVTHDQVEAMTMATRLAVMKDGVLHQVGTPEEVYFRPDNVFVAGFIGSPSMNLLPGKLTGTPEEMRIELKGFELSLPAERSKRVASFAGRDVICGIRPEDMHDRAFVRAEVRGQVIQGRVEVTEMMGNERFLHLLVHEQELLARVDARTRARAGQDVSLLVDVDRVHIFDAATEKVLDKFDLPESPAPVPGEPVASPGAAS